VDSIPRHVASRSTPSLYTLRQPHPTSPSERNTNRLGRYADYSKGGYQLGLVLSRKHDTFVVPVQTPGLPDLPLAATRTPIFGTAGRQQAPFSDTSLYQTGHGFATNILLRPSRTILGLPQARQPFSSKFRSTQTPSTNPRTPELVLTNHAFLTARDVTDPIIYCHIRNREGRRVFESELAQQAINRDRKPTPQWNRPAKLESLSDPTDGSAQKSNPDRTVSLEGCSA
jgi:hypothetical protein